MAAGILAHPDWNGYYDLMLDRTSRSWAGAVIALLRNDPEWARSRADPWI